MFTLCFSLKCSGISQHFGAKKTNRRSRFIKKKKTHNITLKESIILIRLFLGDSPYGLNNHSTKIATFPLFVLLCAVTVHVYVSVCEGACVFGGRGGPASLSTADILIECVWKPDFWFGLKLKCQILIIDNIDSLLHRKEIQL